MRSLPAAAITAASILATSSVLAGPIERTRTVETDTAQAALDREGARAIAENAGMAHNCA